MGTSRGEINMGGIAWYGERMACSELALEPHGAW